MAKVKRFMQWLISDNVWQTIILIGLLFSFYQGRWLEMYGLAAMGIVVTLFEIKRELKKREIHIHLGKPEERGGAKNE